MQKTISLEIDQPSFNDEQRLQAVIDYFKEEDHAITVKSLNQVNIDGENYRILSRSENSSMLKTSFTPSLAFHYMIRLKKWKLSFQFSFDKEGEKLVDAKMKKKVLIIAIATVSTIVLALLLADQFVEDYMLLAMLGFVFSRTVGQLPNTTPEKLLYLLPLSAPFFVYLIVLTKYSALAYLFGIFLQKTGFKVLDLKN